MPDVTMAAYFQGGSIVKGVGFFNMEPWESESSTAQLTLYPKDNTWVPVIGSITDAHGTPLKMTIDGETFRVVGDANFSLQLAKYKNEPQPNTGGNSRKMTLQAREMTSVKLFLSLAEADRLRKKSETP